MVIIDNFFIRYKTPPQFVYWGENYIDIFRIAESNKTFNKIRSIDDCSLTKITVNEFQDIKRELLDMDTGIILNSGQFIFNIFDFEKIPFQENLAHELVEWRLKKVFPEKIDDYEHSYFKLNKNRILSVLLKKNLKQKIETLFEESGISLTYLGNSTVETVNHITALKKDLPDFFIEIDKDLSIMVFQEKRIPYYIRKFRIDKASDITNEVIKTINYVKTSYSKAPRNFSFIIRKSDMDFQQLYDELDKIDIKKNDLKNNERFIFPL